jgi:hypothetical protein
LLHDDKCNEWEKWADFEEGLGKQSIEFKDSATIIECHNDFKNKLTAYLQNEVDKIDFESIGIHEADNVISVFSNSLIGFYNLLHKKTKRVLERFTMFKGNELNIIQLNYTNAFDELLKC